MLESNVSYGVVEDVAVTGGAPAPPDEVLEVFDAELSPVP